MCLTRRWSLVFSLILQPAHLPDAFVPDDDAKLDLYRRLARATSSGDIDGLRDELRERFGAPRSRETQLPDCFL